MLMLLNNNYIIIIIIIIILRINLVRGLIYRILKELRFGDCLSLRPQVETYRLNRCLL
jgi:hypothetical protein